MSPRPKAAGPAPVAPGHDRGTGPAPPPAPDPQHLPHPGPSRGRGKNPPRGSTTASSAGALEAALERVGDRWSLLVVDALLGGPRRFGELERAISGIATNVLAQRLRHLEATRVLLARPYSSRPTRYAYELTGAGYELAGALRLLTQWGADPNVAAGAAPEHAACGTPLDVRWWCPTCDQVVDAGREDPPVFI